MVAVVVVVFFPDKIFVFICELFLCFCWVIWFAWQSMQEMRMCRASILSGLLYIYSVLFLAESFFYLQYGRQEQQKHLPDILHIVPSWKTTAEICAKHFKCTCLFWKAIEFPHKIKSAFIRIVENFVSFIFTSRFFVNNTKKHSNILKCFWAEKYHCRWR